MEENERKNLDHQELEEPAVQGGDQQERHTPKEEAYLLLHDLIYILAVVTIFFVFIVRLVGVSGPSMTSTLLDGDYVALLSSCLCGDPKQNDIIVAKVPDFEDEPIVKRVIATEGQQVDITYDEHGVGTVWVDGVALSEPYINEPMMTPGYATISFPATVPEGYLFVMGDNRNHSADSRYTAIGMFDKRDVLGKVLFVLWPGRGEEGGKRQLSRIGGVS